MSNSPLTWPIGAATGVGSLPGSDSRGAVRRVFDELPDLPHLPELPARGPGADLIGRGAVLLTDTYVDLQPAGWRFTPRPGIDSRRATDFLQRDLDALEEHAGAYAGPLKLQAAGPWTLVAGLELHRGDKALADSGAVRDITAALADGLAGHVRDVARRIPGAQLLVQLDEPSLPAVRLGRVPTASGFGALRAVEDQIALERLASVIEAVRIAGGTPLVHCCASGVPIALLIKAGVVGVGLDAALLTPRDDDDVGEAVEGGAHLFLGTVSTSGPLPGTPAVAADPARGLWRRLGLPPEDLAGQVTVTPACGLAGTPPADALLLLRRCREAGRLLAEEPEVPR